MFGKRFRVTGALIAAAAMTALAPSVANAAGTYFSITNPANGSIIDTIPASPSFSFTPNYGFQAQPFCDYRGPGLVDEVTLSVYCANVTDLPTADGVYQLDVEGSIVQVTPPMAVGPDSDTVSFTLDATDPVVTVSSPASSAYVTQKRPTIQFTTSDANPLTIECNLDGFGFAPCDSATTYQPDDDLSEGAHSVQIRAYDGVNNGYATALFIVDTIAPTVNVTFPTPNAIVDSSVPEVNMAVDGATGGSFCRYDANEYQSCGASWLGGSLADGAHTLSVRAVDLAGNETVVVVPFFVDDSLQSGPLPQSVSLTNSKGTKPKRGKFKVKVGLSVLPSDLNFLDQACKGTVTFAIKPKGGKSYSKRTSLMLANGRCTTSGFITLPAKFKGKKGTLTARYHGSMLISSFRRTRSIKKL